MPRRTGGFWKGAVIPLIFIMIWVGLDAAGKLNTALVPGPLQVGQALVRLSREGTLSIYLAHSLWRVFAGFGLALAFGLPLGLLLGCIPQSRQWFGPTLQFLRQIPPSAWIPLFLLWFGIGEGSKLAVIFSAAFFPILINACLGVQQIPKDYWEVARVLCLSPVQMVRFLILPGSFPPVLAGLRLGMSTSWRAIVAAEIIASTSGLGYLIMASRAFARIDEMVAGIVVIGFIGMLIDGFFVRMQASSLPKWKWEPQKIGGDHYGPAAAAVGTRLQEV